MIAEMDDAFSLLQDTLEEAAREAVARAGGPSALAKALREKGDGKSPSRQSVATWRRVPDRHVLACESITGISRHRLRPDVFGPESGVARSSGSGPVLAPEHASGT